MENKKLLEVKETTCFSKVCIFFFALFEIEDDCVFYLKNVSIAIYVHSTYKNIIAHFDNSMKHHYNEFIAGEFITKRIFHVCIIFTDYKPVSK